MNNNCSYSQHVFKTPNCFATFIFIYTCKHDFDQSTKLNSKTNKPTKNEVEKLENLTNSNPKFSSPRRRNN